VTYSLEGKGAGMARYLEAAGLPMMGLGRYGVGNYGFSLGVATP